MSNQESTYSVVTREEAGVLQALRNKGYAVVIFDPEELQGVKPRHVEDALVAVAWEIIDSLRHEDEDEGDEEIEDEEPDDAGEMI